MPISAKDSRRADDAPVHIAVIMKDGATTGTATDQFDVLFFLQGGQVDFKPWVLVPANDDARVIDVEKEDVGKWV